MQHYAAEIHFLIQEALVTAQFHHCGQYQLDYEDPAAEQIVLTANYLNNLQSMYIHAKK